MSEHTPYSDAPGNSNKGKEEKQPEKKIVEKAIVTEVIVKKKPLGRKFRDMIREADLKGALRHVTTEVLFPGAKNMFYDAGTDVLRRMIFRDNGRRGYRGSSGGHYEYSTPVRRSEYREGIGSRAPRGGGGYAHPARRMQEDFCYIPSREEASEVLDTMREAVDQSGSVSVADLNELLGIRSDHTDVKWGWTYLGDVRIQGTRDGYLIDLPPPEAL